MKDQVQNTIDYFADKTLSFGCLEKRHYRNKYNEQEIQDDEFDTTVMYANKKDVIFIEEEKLMPPNSDFWCSKKEILGHSVNLHRVLKVLQEKGHLGKLVLDFGIETPYGQINVSEYINLLWEQLDLESSLQQIVEESGWEKIEICSCCFKNMEHQSRCETCESPAIVEERLKDPKARALFEFLNTLIK